jgi:hypothetical protein
MSDVVAEYKAVIENRPTHIRAGQAAFNYLYEKAPGWANYIRGGPLDPFHLDERLPAFFEWLQSIVVAEEE